jgi:murein DD-endopeptidase MepM/ murein hydrolase activator NlpD
LQKGGAKVKARQIVQQGDLLGLSGNSGFSTDPHLHFDVTKDCWAGACETLPLCFKNTNSSEVGLVTGNFYLADN